MHETLSKKYIGNIDTVKKDGKNYLIRGWVVPVMELDTCSIGCEGFVSIVPEERQDIFNLYKQSHINYLRSGFVIIVEPTKENFSILVNGELTFTVKIDMMETILKPSIIQSQEITVVNNFYSNPDAVRSYALQLDYVQEKNFYGGYRSTKSCIPSWIKEEFEKYLAKPIQKFTDISGTFQYCTSLDPVLHHINQQNYAAMIFLTPDAPLSTGTSNFRSKITKLTHGATKADAAELSSTVFMLDGKSFNNNRHDRNNLETADSVANVYNRLVIFNGRSIHSVTSHFGISKEDSRLVHVFFFS